MASAHQAQPGPLADMGRKHLQCWGWGEGQESRWSRVRGGGGNRCPCPSCSRLRSRVSSIVRGLVPGVVLLFLPSGKLPQLLWRLPVDGPIPAAMRTEGSCAPELGSAPQGLPAHPAHPG